MDEVQELNDEFLQRLTDDLEEGRKMLEQLNSAYPEVMQVKQRLLNYDIPQFKKNVEDRLKNKLIAEWIKYGKQGNVDSYDMIYFEYHEQDRDHSHAYSYAVYDHDELEEYEYKFDWEAGEGLLLEPFEATEPLDYRNFEDNELYIENLCEDSDSGSDTLWEYIYAICDLVFHEAIRKVDEEGLLNNIKLKSGGSFSYNMHDNGLGTPFYFKK